MLKVTSDDNDDDAFAGDEYGTRGAVLATTRVGSGNAHSRQAAVAVAELERHNDDGCERMASAKASSVQDRFFATLSACCGRCRDAATSYAPRERAGTWAPSATTTAAGFVGGSSGGVARAVA